jgi:excisionase family DNA binding protein
MTLKGRLGSGVWVRACAAALFMSVGFAAEAAPRDEPACPSAVMTLNEAAALLRVDATILERAAEAGGVPGRRIGTEWRFDCVALRTWLQADALDRIRGRGLPGQQDPTAATPSTQAAAPAAAIGEAPEDRTAEDVFLRGSRVLLGPGDVVVDVGQFYARRDSLQLASFASGVGLATLEQSSFTTVVVGRVGILNETEVFAGTAYSTQNTQQLAAGTVIGISDGSGFRSTTTGIRRTVLREGVKRPVVVASFSGQIPTRDALPAVGGGLVMVKSLDPVVLFASANYVHPFERITVARRPVDTVDVTLGYGLGLNDATAISLAVGGVFAETTSTEGGTLKSPSLFSLRFSVTTALGQGMYLEPSVSIGLSGPGHSFAFGITMPFAF